VLQGFQRVADNLADTALDNPRASEEFPTIVAAAQATGWLDAAFEVGPKTSPCNSPACAPAPCIGCYIHVGLFTNCSMKATIQH